MSPGRRSGRCSRCTCFEHGRREVTNRRVPAPCVVEAFDEIEDREFGVGGGKESGAVEELALERGEEALAHRVVVAIADRTHRGANTVFATRPAELDRRVLATLVRVTDEVIAGLTPIERHRERIGNEFRR